MPRHSERSKTHSDALLRVKEKAVANLLTTHVRIRHFAALAATSSPEENVVGIGLGQKLVKGKATSAMAVRIYVRRKLPNDAVATRHALPSKIDNVPTDVVEVGRLRAQPARIPKERQRARPARPGCSIGFAFEGAEEDYVMAGTFGALVTDGSKLYILSNNHVIANENELEIGAPIFQPGRLDGGKLRGDKIAELTQFVRMKFGGRSWNVVDAAIAEVLKTSLVRTAVLPKVGKLQSATPLEVREKMRVHKTGRTTGYTTGRVIDVAADMRIEYDGKIAAFRDQILIEGDEGDFSDEGDSGSLIVDRKTQRAVGLLFGGSAQVTIANHLTDVLSALQVELKI